MIANVQLIFFGKFALLISVFSSIALSQNPVVPPMDNAATKCSSKNDETTCNMNGLRYLFRMRRSLSGFQDPRYGYPPNTQARPGYPDDIDLADMFNNHNLTIIVEDDNLTDSLLEVADWRIFKRVNHLILTATGNNKNQELDFDKILYSINRQRRIENVTFEGNHKIESVPISLQNFAHLKSLNFIGTALRNVVIRDKPNLESVTLRRNAFPGLNADSFVNLPNLRSITIDETIVSYLGAGTFGGVGSSLEYLQITKGQLTDEALKKIGKLGKLKHLNLVRNYNIEFQDIGDLLQNVPNLQHLELDYNKILYLNNSGFRYSKKLQYLSLTNNILREFDVFLLTLLPKIKEISAQNNGNLVYVIHSGQTMDHHRLIPDGVKVDLSNSSLIQFNNEVRHWFHCDNPDLTVSGHGARNFDCGTAPQRKPQLPWMAYYYAKENLKLSHMKCRHEETMLEEILSNWPNAIRYDPDSCNGAGAVTTTENNDGTSTVGACALVYPHQVQCCGPLSFAVKPSDPQHCTGSKKTCAYVVQAHKRLL